MRRPVRRRAGRAVAGLALAWVAAVGCTSSADDSVDDGADPVRSPGAPTAPYRAEWLIDPSTTSAGDEAAGAGFVYRELVDMNSGRFLIQSPNHLAAQDREHVTFCAAILRVDPRCARAERADGMPDVQSYAVQLLRTWSPGELFELATFRELQLESRIDPDAWTRSSEVSSNGYRVECFTVTGPTNAALPGFKACFTDDELHLVASIDLQGDLLPEVDLVSYERVIAESDWITGYEELVEESSRLQEQLLRLFPELPAPRPTPTPEGA